MTAKTRRLRKEIEDLIGGEFSPCVGDDPAAGKAPRWNPPFRGATFCPIF